MVAGCTGYIGRFVTKELIKRGYQVVAFSREKSGVGGKKSMDDVQSTFCARACLLWCWAQRLSPSRREDTCLCACMLCETRACLHASRLCVHA